MFDWDTEAAVFDFDELANHLVEQGSRVSPSEIHGCLTGLLAAGMQAEAEFGLDALAEVLDLVAHGELAGEVLRLYRVTAEALRDEEFSFQPLLPDDDTDIDVRTAELARWNSSFLAGFAFIEAQAEAKKTDWSSDAREILEDIAAITEAAVDEDGDEDEEEGNYIEVVEFLRVAVLNLAMEKAMLEDERASGSPNDSLH